MPPNAEPALRRWSPPPVVAQVPRESRGVHSPRSAPKIRPVANHPSQMSAAATQICRWTGQVPRLAPSQSTRGGTRTVPSSHRPKRSSSSPAAGGNRPLRQVVIVGRTPQRQAARPRSIASATGDPSYRSPNTPGTIPLEALSAPDAHVFHWRPPGGEAREGNIYIYITRKSA